MNVRELREALQGLEANGLGDLPVVVKDCICHDSDNDLVDTVVYELEVDAAKSTYRLELPLTEGLMVVRLVL